MRSKTFLTVVNIQELTFAASTDDSSRTTPNPEKGSEIERLFKLYNLNPKEYINARLIEDLEILLKNKTQANGESPLIGFGSKKALEYFLNNYNRIRAKQIFEQLENRKDNPVPSLDLSNEEFEVIIESLKFKGDLYASNPASQVAKTHYDLVNKLKKNQNGRTTDKENLIEMIYIQGNEDILDFKIGKYPVTQKQWVNIMDNNPSYFKNDNCPVENVSWKDVQDFIKKLNAKTGKKYRLPTEEEWEFAARGGNQSKGYEYSGSNNIKEVAWYGGNSDKKTHPVGELKPNELGLYDMSGNVWEWCQDIYKPYLDDSKNTSDYWSRVLRGGSWSNAHLFCRVAFRDWGNPDLWYLTVGFRLAQSI